jgi:hypothetical protein
MILSACFVKMYYFAIAFQIEIPYHLAPPQGWEAVWIFENLAVSKKHSALSQNPGSTAESGGATRFSPTLRQIDGNS